MPLIKKKDKKKNEPVMTENRVYYFSIAKRFRVAMFATVLFLCVFELVMLTVYHDEISVENFKYFVRYIDTRQAEKTATSNTIIYDDTEAVAAFGIYKNGLVVVGYDNIKIYDLTGEAVFDIDQVNAEPQLQCGDKYMLIYNLGSTTFQLYSSIAKVYEEAYTYPIGVASLGDTGSFLVSTRSMEYRSLINVYNKNFEIIYRWYTPDKLVMDAAFQSGDKEFIISALGTNTDGSCYSEIILCPVDSEEKKAQFRLEDEVIYRVSYTEDGGFVLIGGKAVYYYNKDAECIQTISYNGYTPTSIYADRQYVYYTLNKNIVGSNYTLMITDTKGDVLYDGIINGEITQILIADHAAYLLLDRSLLRVSLDTGEQIERSVDANAVTLLAPDEETLWLCYASETKIIDIDSFFFETES